MDWVDIVVSILSGLAVTIPLVVELVKYVQKAIQEKNWNNLLKMVMDLMAQAEKNFDNGADRREWVINMVMQSANTINYPMDEEALGKLIDSLCDLTKQVNIAVQG